MNDTTQCPGLVVLYRVSTDSQGESGLGMAAQKSMVEAYQRQVGLPIIKTFSEVESGKRTRRKINLSAPIWQLIEHRPALKAAIQLCQKSGYRLVIAKLDRLARDVAFTACLQGAAVDFVACDNAAATPLTIGILSVIAQEEARAISDRTRAALSALKARGVKLGSAAPGNWAERNPQRRLASLVKARTRSSAVRSASAREAYQDLAPMMKELHASGQPLEAIAKHLNDSGQTTRRGCQWSAPLVWRVLNMYC